MARCGNDCDGLQFPRVKPVRFTKTDRNVCAISKGGKSAVLIFDNAVNTRPVNTANAIGRMAVISQHFNNTAILQQDGTVTARAPVNHHAV